ncbi:MAG: hypothetical protein WA634_01675 [Silvibacterium sp.]
MRRFLLLSIFFSIALVGCESKQAKIDKLQAQYTPLNTQYNKDCIAPAFGAKGAEGYLKGETPKVPTPQEEAAHNQKCAQELQQVTALEKQIEALQK